MEQAAFGQIGQIGVRIRFGQPLTYLDGALNRGQALLLTSHLTQIN
ncbi:hypothetical protein ABZU75_43560 [Streptosporangium sp. NPDC005286]